MLIAPPAYPLGWLRAVYRQSSGWQLMTYSMRAMEIIVISAIFLGIVVGGAALAVSLIVRAVRADQRYLDAEEHVV